MSMLSQHCGVQEVAPPNGSCSPNTSAAYSSGLSSAASASSGLQVAVELYVISFVACVGLLGNALSVVALRRDRERRTSLVLLQVLALSDGLYLLSALARYPVKYLVHDTALYHSAQLYVYPLLKMFQTITIWMMVLVTADRYVYVCKPLRAPGLLTAARRRLFAVLVFVAGVLYSLPRFFDRCLVVYRLCDNHTVTGVIYKPAFNNAYYYNIYRYAMHLVFLYLGPLVALCVMNAQLIAAIRSSKQLHREMRVKGGHCAACTSPQTENNATVVLVVIILVFVVCETPELILRILIVLDQHLDTISAISPAFYRFNTVSALFMVINCSINFFIYFLFGKRFRYILKETFIYKFQTTTSLLTRETLPLRQQNVYV